jgi:3-isopropylmalate/(R)-2-methylmalate dehydratase small subunit
VFTVDLERCRVAAPDGDEVPFAVDRRRREALLQGLDEITLTLRREPEIAAFQAADRRRRPWVYL